MPINPAILLQGLGKPVELDSPSDVEARQLQNEQRRALIEQAQERRRAVIEAAQDNATMQALFKTHLGPDGLPDIDEMIKTAYKTNPRVATKLQAAAQSARKAALETSKLQDEHKTALIESSGRILQGANEQNWDVRLPVLKSTNPEVGAMFDGPWSEQTAEKIKAFGDAITPRKEFLDLQQKARDQILEGKPQKAIADELLAYGDRLTPDITMETFRTHRDQYNTPSTVIAPMAQMASQPGPDGKPDMTVFRAYLRNVALGQKEVETLAAQETAHKDLVAERKADNARQELTQTETARHNKVMEALAVARLNKPPASQQEANDNAKSIADAIISGEQQPTLTGLYRYAAPVRAELAKQHYDLAHATEDWNATTKYLSTLNGQQQVRLNQAINFTTSSLDVVEDLAKQWDAGGFPVLNKARLSLAANGALGPKAQAIATKLKAQIADVTSELGTVYKGGNSSTDESLKLAAQNLSTDWSKETLLSNIQQIRQNLHIRTNSMKLGVAGARPNSVYAPSGATAPPPDQKKDPLGIR